MDRLTMARLMRLLLTALGVGLAPLVASHSAFAQTKTITITVDDPRPMAAAIRKIEELSGIPINYEDMPVYQATDIKDVTDEVSRTRTSDRRILVHRGGQLSAAIVVDEASGTLKGTKAVEDALRSFMSAYASNNLPGSFEFELYNNIFFVKPANYRDANGVTRPMASILSSLITFRQEARDSVQTIQLVLNEVAKQQL